MLQSGITFVLSACAVAVIPSSALSQATLPLDAAARDSVPTKEIGFRVDGGGAVSGPRIVVAQNLVTPNGTAPVPNVNDCTFIRDPIALRDCINLYEGQRLAPGPRIGEPRTNVIVDKDLIDAAGPIPGSGGRSDGGSRAPINPTDLNRSDAAYIEQVSPPR